MSSSVIKQIFKSRSLKLFWSETNDFLDQIREKISEESISKLTDEELSIAKQYLLHRLEREISYLIDYAKKPIRTLMRDSGERVKRIVILLDRIFEEEARRISTRQYY